MLHSFIISSVVSSLSSHNLHLLLIRIPILLLASFSYQRYVMNFQWSLGDSKSLQVFRTLFCILADVRIAVVLIISARPPISNYFNPITLPLGTVTSA